MKRSMGTQCLVIKERVAIKVICSKIVFEWVKMKTKFNEETYNK